MSKLYEGGKKSPREARYYGEHKILDMSLRGAQRRSNLNSVRSNRLLRFARNDNVIKCKE